MKTLCALFPYWFGFGWLSCLALPASGQSVIPGPAYVRSSVGQPWGVSANEQAMDRAFGPGQWRDLRFESVNAAQLFADSTVLFLEGSDQGALALESFLLANQVAVRNWVAAGGVLFVNAAPNVGDGMSFGFGVTLLYFDGTSTARANNSSHRIFNGPFTPVGSSWSGSIGHATVSGTGLIPLIVNLENGRSVLGEMGYGSGWVLFGGMTTDNFHSPQPEAQNLRANILAYADSMANLPTNLPPAILTQPISRAVLAGETVTFTAAARGSRPLRLQWYRDGQLVPGATNASLVLVQVNTNQAGGYKLVATNPLGAATSERATLTVSVQGPRILSHPGSRSVLAGEDVSLSVVASGGPLFYQWRRNGVDVPGETNATLHLAAVTAVNAGTYQVAVSNLLGYVTSLPAVLSVDQFAPTIISQPSDVSVASGDAVQFFVQANGAPPPTYQWIHNGVLLPGETNLSLYFPAVTTNQAGGYSVVAANISGSVTSQVAVLTVNEYPASIGTQPVSQTVTAGSDVGFSVGVFGSPPFTFQWRHNGTNLPGATNAQLFLQAVHPNRQGSYTVAVSNHLGGVISVPAFLTVIGGAPPVFTSQPSDFPALLAGGSATLTASASGQPAPNYQWRFNGANLPGATLSFLTLTSVTTNQAGQYSVVASNLFGTATSRVALVTVNFQSPIISAHPASRTVDAGSTVTFTVTATAGPPPGYQWLFNNDLLPGATSSTLVLSNVLPSRAGSYSVIVSNQVGSVTSAPASLTINAAAPVITSQPASRTVLDGSNVTFVVSATGVPQVTFQWRFNGMDMPGRNGSVLSLNSISTNAAGQYSVVVSNLIGVTVSEPAILTVTQQAPVITAQTTNRTVQVGANVIFQVLAVAGPRPTYQWRRDGVNIPGATATSLIISNVSRAHEADYTVVVSNPLGSVTSQPMRLTVIYQPPTITGHPTNRTVVAGSNATFTVTANGSAPFFYQWRLNGANLPGGTNQTLVLIGVMTNQAGGYSVVVTNFGGAATSTVATLTVTTHPPIITTQPANRTVPGGTNVTFTVVANGAPPPVYQWRYNGAEIPGATNPQLTLFNVGTNHAGGYSVVVSNPSGSLTSRVATLTVIVQAPSILVQPSDRTVRPGGSAIFSVVASGTPPLGYQWDYNGEDIPGATNATLTLTDVAIEDAGSYRVTITSAGGTLVSRKAELSVREVATGDFFIGALLTNNARLVEHNFASGDDRGGIAVSSSHVFYSGDIQTARFAVADLSGGAGVGRIYDALISDLNTETVYSLGNGATPLGSGGEVTTLIGLDGASGLPTANVIELSQPISMQSGSGLFAGYDQIALFTGSRVYSVELPSGLVTDHGPFSMPAHMSCENWAFWGVAEFIDGELHLAYVRDSQTIARVRVADGLVEPIATFGNLADMCSFTLSLSLNRWYFHHEGISQFGGFDESVGYADATWELGTGGPPYLRRQPQSLGVLGGQSAEFSVAASGAHPLFYQWRHQGANLPGATNQTLLLPNAGTNNAGAYTVVVTNALGAVTSQVATLTVQLVPPSILAQPVGRTAIEGAQVRFSVIATGAPPPFYQWQFNGADITGATNPVLTLASVSNIDSGTYRARVGNLLGSIFSADAVLTVSSRSNAVSVLIIWDVLNTNTTALQRALEAAGFLVELSAASEAAYDGTNPSPDGFDAVIHLNGALYDIQMPVAGQETLVQYVEDGGGYLGSEWNAYEISQGRMAAMRDLVLFDRVDQGLDGLNTWEIVPAQADHPLLDNVPASFSFRAAVNFGPVHHFALEPATVLMRDPAGHDAVAVREFGEGRIVGFEHAGNYDLGNGPYGTLSDPNIQQLYISAVFWAAGGSSPNLPPSIVLQPADRSVALGRTVTLNVGARGTRPLGYQWRLGVGALPGATNASLVLSNATLSHAGAYTVVVTNAFGAVTSAPAIVTVSEITTVAVFDDPLFVDTSGGSQAESDTVQASLVFLGYGISTFTNIEAATGNLVLLFPELEVDYLAGALDQDAQYALAQFVETGGSMIVHGTPQEPSWTTDLLNQVFGFGVSAYSETDGTSFTRTTQADSTAFAANVATLSANHGSSSLHTGSLPGTALSVYEESGRSLVAVLPYGLGKVIFLGWDWNNAAPLGSADNGWLDVLDSAIVEAGGPRPATNRPPVIAVQPAGRTVLLGAVVSLNVKAGGSPPLSYQWRFNGLNLPGATNATLVLTNVSSTHAGSYTVVVSNPFGTVTSQPAFLNVLEAPANAEFRITSLTPNHSLLVQHEGFTGDDHGGIALSASQLFYTGDSSTARFAASDLSAVSLGRLYDAMISNLRTETIYSLATDEGLYPESSGPVTRLLEIDGETGELTTNAIVLSEPIHLTPEAGLFAGYDQVVLLTGGRAYTIHLPTGLVTDLGPMSVPEHQGCETWAFWGVAEKFDGAVHLVYVRDNQTIVRTRVPDGATEVVAVFENLSDMCSFTLSLSLNRWYFHHEGVSQFGGNDENVGYADATWEFPVPPVPPGIAQAPQSVEGLWGGSAMFNVVATGQLLTYQWYFNQSPLPGGNAASLLLSNLTPAHAGQYAVVVRNPFGAVTSAPAALTVRALAPVISTPPVSQSAVLGADVLFAADVTAAPQATLQWFFNNAAIPGATNATLFLTNVTLSAAGGYRIVADNFAGSAISPVATLVINPQVPLPVALDTAGQVWTTGGDALWVGQPFTAHDGVDAAESGFLFDDEQSWLQTTVTGPGRVSFWWKVSSEADYDFVQFSVGGITQAIISGEVDWQQRTISFPAGPQVLRWAYVKDGSVGAGRDRAWLDDVRVETAPIIVTQPISQIAAVGSSATFRVVATGAGPLRYQWRFKNADLAGATNATLFLEAITPDHAGEYSVRVSNGLGSTDSVLAILSVLEASTFINFDDLTASTAFSEVVRLTNRYAAMGVVFEGPGGLDGGAIVNEGGAFGVSGHSSPNFLAFNSGAFMHDGGVPRGPETLRFATPKYQLRLQVGSSQSGNVTLTAYSSGGTILGTVTRPMTSALQTLEIVASGIVRAEINSSSSYWVVDNLEFNAALTPPTILQQPQSQTVPAGSDVVFQVDATSSYPLAYQWQLNGAPIQGATNRTLSLEDVLPANAGDYTVVLSNPLGTVVSAPATLTVILQAPVILTQPASQTVLGGGSVALSVSVTGVPAPTYQWKHDGADIPGATNATLALNDVSASDGGTYKVVVRNLAGTATSLPARLTVNILPPQITVQPVSRTVLRGTNVTFTVVATGAPAPAYQWRFNESDLVGQTGPSLTIIQPTALHAGRYTVRVNNSGGTVISHVAELTVLDSIELTEALDLPGVIWRSGGGAPWFGQPMTSHDGVDAASSGGVADARESWLETTVLGPGTVSFSWKVSCELGFDRLNFSVGNVPMAAISGATDWQRLSFPLAAGTQTLRWSYAKDGSARDGADAGWVDQVVITTSPALIVQVAVVGADVRLSFPTSPGRRYRVESADALTPVIEWQPVAGGENLSGTGQMLELWHAGGAGARQRFYRVALLP